MPVQEEVAPADRWIALLMITRVLGAVMAVTLLVAHRVTEHDPLLGSLAVAWTVVTLFVLTQLPAVRASPLAWVVDTGGALAFVLASGDWRSPFYLFALTTLVLPATRLPWRAALAWSAGFSLLYAIVAGLTRQLPANTIEDPVRLETLATHLAVPLLVTIALAYSGAVLNRLREERERSEALAVQTERQRIAWELHDSAKQRVHAAHLLLSALQGRLAGADHELAEHAAGELRAATADMETSIAELRTPIDGRPVPALLRERAAELQRAAQGTRIEVHGDLPRLAPTVAAHVHRIAVEALTNAVRHAGCARVEVRLGADDGTATVEVVDDGQGLPDVVRPQAQGLRSMRGRAERIGAELDIGARPDGVPGTRVRLAIPLDAASETSSTPTPTGALS